MITRQTKLQLMVFALIAIAGLTFTGARYAGLAKYFINEGYTVNADFVDSGGIFKGAEVTYRGVPVGEVESLELLPQGVRAHLKLETGTEVPTGAKAIVQNRSAVGEQYVDLQPQRDGKPYMASGDTIPIGATAIPIQPTQLLVNLDRFINSVDTQDVGIVLDQLGDAFEGRGQDLQRLVDAGNELTRAASDNLPQTLALINDGKTVLDTQRATSGQFRSFNRDLHALTDQLRASDPDFRSLFANGTQAALNTTDLVEANRSDLGILLNNLVTVAQVQKVRIPQLRQVLVTYPNVIAGGFTVAPGDGTAHFGSATSTDPGVCQAGYEDGLRPTSDVSTRTPNLNVYCAEPEPVDVRGAAHAQYAPGAGPFPGPGSSAGGGTSTAAGTSAAATRSGDSVQAADQISGGRVMTQDGQVLHVGSTAGAAKVFGESSWQWLLVGPLQRG